MPDIRFKGGYLQAAWPERPICKAPALAALPASGSWHRPHTGEGAAPWQGGPRLRVD